MLKNNTKTLSTFTPGSRRTEIEPLALLRFDDVLTMNDSTYSQALKGYLDSEGSKQKQLFKKEMIAISNILKTVAEYENWITVKCFQNTTFPGFRNVSFYDNEFPGANIGAPLFSQ